MQVPFLDLKVQYKSIKKEIDDAIQNVLDNTAFILGDAVHNFEQEFAKEHNVKYCLGTSSGTDANHLVLWAAGIKTGDEVIIPANTFIATAWGATLCGATPVFVDCHPLSYNIDPEKIIAAITPRTKAIVAVHLYGQPADIDNLKQIADKYNLLLVEDAAQAHFAEYNGKRIGSTTYATSFSFYPGKNLGAFGEGGAVVTNNDEVFRRVKLYREHGQSQKYYHETYGHNYRMEGIQGAVLGVKLKHLDSWTEGRRKVAAKYRERLSSIEQLILPTEMLNVKHVYHLFVTRVNTGINSSSNRDELQNYLKDNGIATGLHYPVPLHQQKCFEHLGYKKGAFPVTENLAETGISLPMFAELSDQQIDYVCDKIREYFKK